MCLAIPMKLVQVCDAERGTAELDGVRYEVNLSLVEEPSVGEYVIVHTGFAIEKLDEKEAQDRIVFFRELAQSQSEAPCE